MTEINNVSPADLEQSFSGSDGTELNEHVSAFSADSRMIGKRIDKVLSETFPEISRSYLQQLIEENHVLVDGKSVKPSLKLKEGNQIEVTFPEPEPLDVTPEDIPLDIRYEDDDLLIVNKPQGMVVHPAAGNEHGTLVNALLYHCSGKLSAINGVERPGIVHRIDKDTSGLLVCAKSDAAHKGLSEQFAVHSITRVYTAVCYGHLPSEEITVDKAIGRSKDDRKKMACRPDGKRAVTHFKEIEQLKGYSVIECRLETGRTHQIRVHAASLGHPLLGDTVYGPAKTPFSMAGQTLHAGILGFRHPVTGEDMLFQSELPPYFEKILTRLRQEN